MEYLRRSSLPDLLGVFTFLRRRLVPAVATVEAARHRIEGLSGRVFRTADVLRTRVKVAAEIATQQLLSGLHRGQTRQLRLQLDGRGILNRRNHLMVGWLTIWPKGLSRSALRSTRPSRPR
ncbi:MAG: DUF3422 domain-containing protein [Mycobacterium sp.]|nr:MAG: DUF3422 domain-containing protein [Mycobacterium sp.]